MLRSLANLSGSEGDADTTVDEDEAVALLHAREVSITPSFYEQFMRLQIYADIISKQWPIF